MGIHIHVRYVRSSLAVVVFHSKSENRISPGTDFAGGSHEGKYSSDIRFIQLQIIESNSGKTDNYLKKLT